MPSMRSCFLRIGLRSSLVTSVFFLSARNQTAPQRLAIGEMTMRELVSTFMLSLRSILPQILGTGKGSSSLSGSSGRRTTASPPPPRYPRGLPR